MLRLLIGNPSAFFHIHSSVGKEGDALGFEQGAAKLCEAAACNAAVIAHFTLPWKILGAAAHRPADLTGAFRHAEHPSNLTV